MRKFLLFTLLILVLSVSIPLAFYLKFGKYCAPKPESEEIISVFVSGEDRIVDMAKSDYLKCVVSAEMPADFHIEALKAQAVAARSYLDSRMSAYKKSGTPEEHKGADICTDPTHCKAWISKEERMKSWGDEAEKNWGKISRAVDETSGEIITYNDEVISAVFHSTSSGHTENSSDVWGGEKPYLVSVESVGDQYSPKYKSEKTVSLDEFKNIILDSYPSANFDSEIVGDITRSNAGGIIEVSIGGVLIKGTELRNLFGLRSTNINISVNDTCVHFDVTGYGHGVGMSQYGANYLANQGKSYVDILKTYYKGVEIR